MKLSIIIPFFNVEQYIRACVESIYRQDLSDDNFELILVNDGSTDKSIDMIKDTISSHSNIIVVNQQNKGLSVARNVGLSMSSGDYILFVDSDDLLVDGALYLIYQTILDCDAEMFFANYSSMTDDEITLESKNLKSLNSNTKSLWVGSGTEYVSLFFDHKCFVWRVVYKKDFLDKHQISFMPNICFEDIPFTTECLTHLKKCVKTDVLLYIYRQRSGSIVNTMNIKKLFDMIYILSLLINNRQHNNYSPRLKYEVTNLIFATFSDFLWYILSDKIFFEKRKMITLEFKRKIPRFILGNNLKHYLTSILFNYIPCRYIEIRKYIDVVIKNVKDRE